LAAGCERKPNGELEPPQTVEQGLEQAGQVLERGADKAGEALQRGVEKARPTVERGVKDVGEMIEDGAKKAAPALEDGVKKLGKAIEEGVEKTGEVLAEPAEKPSAEATFETQGTTELEGHAKFFEREGKVRVVVSVRAASPGAHGIHIHQKGDCSDLKGKSMGSHFDTRSHRHGLPRGTQHHLGDLGNIKVADDGRGELDVEVADATVAKPAPSSFVGKAIVIHASEDTGKGPTGNSGDPIACGVIKATST
jgi:Cu-Zn family superoxide dismutase